MVSAACLVLLAVAGPQLGPAFAEARSALDSEAVFERALIHSMAAQVKRQPLVRRPQGKGHNYFEDDNPDIDDHDKDDRDHVCFDDLGCYTREIAGTLPSHPEDIEPFFSLNNADKTMANISWDASEEEIANLTQPLFSEPMRARPLILVAHGFGESLRKQWVWNLSGALLSVYKDATVMLVDWRKACFIPLYNRASANVPLVSRIAVRAVQRLMSVYPQAVRPDDIHFVGFSLGGQMAGYFARQFFNATGARIGRITALDTAAPNFQKLEIMPRRGDARFIEAVHTSAGDNIIAGKVGIVQPYADIDYYPNGGIKQPGCSILRAACSHQRAFAIFTHALLEVNNCQMKGIRCSNVKEANEHKCSGQSVGTHYVAMADPSKFQRFDDDFHVVYFNTTTKAPFCI